MRWAAGLPVKMQEHVAAGDLGYGVACEIARLQMIQWTPGAGQPDPHDERWWPMYHQILDADKKVLAIKGVENLREGLQGMIGKSDEAKYFVAEIAPFFSQRENQLVQAYMEQYGAMPKGVGADEMDDLF